MRLLAAELGDHGVKVNGINPTGLSVAPASSPGLGRQAGRGLRGARGGVGQVLRLTHAEAEVLPENVANAVFVLCSADLSHTTGLHIPVDAGVAAAFLR